MRQVLGADADDDATVGVAAKTRLVLEDRFAEDMRWIPIGTELAPSPTVASNRFIAGEPMKPATKRLFGWS